jgi:hypothetical protein
VGVVEGDVGVDLKDELAHAAEGAAPDRLLVISANHSQLA